MRMICLLLLGCYTLALAYMGDDCDGNLCDAEGRPLVQTSSGLLSGQYVKVFDTKVAAFLGIPYAQPPVNEKRFLKPTPVDHWCGIFDATIKPLPCMQYSRRKFSWTPNTTPVEDCLYLNVWTPAKCFCCGGSERLPVLVWIYGGGYYAGSTDLDVYDGSTLASESKTVVVSINYRVGIFGFLNIGKPEAPGNMGLIDQNVALKWIQKNIGYFGGNPDRITIMGQGTGAMSISLHMVSPMSQNLFHAAILQSATSYQPEMVDSKEASYVKANDFTKVIGCGNDSSRIESDPEVMKCLKGKDSFKLLEGEGAFTSQFFQYFLPSYGEEFLPTSPFKSFNEGHIAPVDILIGNNKDEATIFLSSILSDKFGVGWERQINSANAKEFIAALFENVHRPSAEDIFNQYFSDASWMELSKVIEIISNAYGDYMFNCPVIFFAEKVRNAYVYWIAHRSNPDQNANWLRVPHFYEVPFVFGVPIQNISDYTPEDVRFSKDFVKKWSTFAQMGHPLGDKNPEKWPLFTVRDQVAYVLNRERGGMIIFPRAKACEFWRPYIAPKTC